MAFDDVCLGAVEVGRMIRRGGLTLLTSPTLHFRSTGFLGFMDSGTFSAVILWFYLHQHVNFGSQWIHFQAETWHKVISQRIFLVCDSLLWTGLLKDFGITLKQMTKVEIKLTLWDWLTLQIISNIFPS